VYEETAPSIIDSLWRYRWFSLGVVIITVLLSVVAGLLVAPNARAFATMGLTPPQAGGVLSTGTSDAALTRYTEQRAQFIFSDAVMEAVAERLGRDDITALRGAVRASPSSASNTIDITIEAASGSAAVELGDAVIEAYRVETEREVADLTARAVDSIDQMERRIRTALVDEPDPQLVNAAAGTIGQLQLQIIELGFAAALFGDGVQFVEAPRAEAVATAGQPVREAALGLILGLVFAATLAWLRADRDRRVMSALQSEPVLQAPLLGELRAAADVSFWDTADLDRMPSHDFRLVWTALLRLLKRAPADVLLVNATQVPARSSTALNLAVAAVRDNLSVLLVEADIEGAPLTEALVLPEHLGGLCDLLRSGGDYRKQVHEVDIGGSRYLSVLPAGSEAQDLNLSTQRVEDYVEAWRRDFDLVIIDAQQVGSGQLPSVLSGVVGSVLVVVSKGADERSLQEYRRRVGLQGTTVIGYVFAASTRRRPWTPSGVRQAA
jgi:polysaccharide biosynthesis transport protein